MANDFERWYTQTNLGLPWSKHLAFPFLIPSLPIDFFIFLDHRRKDGFAQRPSPRLSTDAVGCWDVERCQNDKIPADPEISARIFG